MSFKSKEQKELDKENNKDTYISTVVQHVKLSSLGYAVVSDILEHANSLYNTLTFNLRQGFMAYSTLLFQSNDELPVFGKETEAQKSQKPSGKRTNRGEYKTANGTTINADANGAANILRKAKIDVSKITFRVCQVLKKINIWVGKKSKGTVQEAS